MLYTILALLVFLTVPFADARGRSSTARSKSSRAVSTHSIKVKSSSVPKARASTSHAKATTRCTSCARDPRGRIARSTNARQSFQKSHPCPSTGKTSGVCSGYVIDHRAPLKRGGADAATNMQWQTVQAAKAKDKIE